MSFDPVAVSAALAAAGCPNDGLAGPYADASDCPSSWTLHPAGDGTLWRIDFSAGDTDAQRQAGIAALAGYAPAAPAPSVTGRQIFGQARAQGVSAAVSAFLSRYGQTDAMSKPLGPKPDDYLYWLGIALDSAVPVDNPKVGRILVAAGVVERDGSSAVPAFMRAAMLLPA